MPKCDYCGDSFPTDDALDDHLVSDHSEELGRIDSRRLDVDADDEDDGLSVGIVMLAAVMALALVAVGAAMYLAGGEGGSEGPTDVGSVHYHGTLDMVVDGETIDFSNPQYQYGTTGEDAFHFEGGDGSQWHVHARGVTLEYAMASLGFEVTETSVTYEGTTYRDEDANTTVTVAVNSQSVTPGEYVLQEGDHIRIVVEQS